VGAGRDRPGAAQAGDAAAADAARAEMAHRPLRHKGFEPELGIASAWAAAARGELSRAAPLALGAAALARDRGQSAFEVRALHEAARLGGAREAAARLAALAGEVDGGLADAAAEHAAGLVAGDGPRLLAAAERFAAMDALLVAAEAAHAAGAAYAAAGRAASARSAAARGRTWLARCEGARPVTLLAPEAADDLTAREREIALLAAGGLSSRTIAERLVVSVRTVDNHLQRAYRKLGVTRREELAGVLQDAAE
jgi:DNA-binding CsgD family transcriptional regulator